MSKCKTYIPTPLVEDLCGGNKQDTRCIVEESAFLNLGIESNSNQQDINQAVYNALQASKTTTDELQLQIDDMPTTDGSETKVTSGTNVTVTGVGTTLSPYVINGQSSPFEKIDEGNGEGYVIKGRNSTFYGSIGVDALDFSYSGIVSSTFGATGESSFATGIDNISSGYNSSTFGYKNINNAIGGFTGGFNSLNAGYTNFVNGVGQNVTGMNITVVGQAANIISESILSHNVITSPVFVVGNGTIIDDNADYPVATRSDALIVRKNGVIEAPSLSILEINNGLPKTIPTKEWVQSQKPYKIYSGLISQTGINAPIFTVLENTLGDTLNFGYVSDGYYSATLNAGLTSLLTNMVFVQNNNAKLFQGESNLVYSTTVYANTGYVFYLSTELQSGVSANDLLVNEYIEFRVYN